MSIAGSELRVSRLWSAEDLDRFGSEAMALAVVVAWTNEAVEKLLPFSLETSELRGRASVLGPDKSGQLISRLRAVWLRLEAASSMARPLARVKAGSTEASVLVPITSVRDGIRGFSHGNGPRRGTVTCDLTRVCLAAGAYSASVTLVALAGRPGRLARIGWRSEPDDTEYIAARTVAASREIMQRACGSSFEWAQIAPPKYEPFFACHFGPVERIRSPGTSATTDAVETGAQGEFVLFTTRAVPATVAALEYWQPGCGQRAVVTIIRATDRLAKNPQSGRKNRRPPQRSKPDAPRTAKEGAAKCELSESEAAGQCPPQDDANPAGAPCLQQVAPSPPTATDSLTAAPA